MSTQHFPLSTVCTISENIGNWTHTKKGCSISLNNLFFSMYLFIQYQ